MKQEGNILVITYWSFDSALVQTYTLPYLRIMRRYLPGGTKLFLFTLNTQPLDATAKAAMAKLEAEHIYVLSFNYSRFGWLMLAKLKIILAYLAVFCFTKKIRYIHAWCTPGGAIGYLLSVITGKPLVLDSFEPHAIPMVEGGTWRRSGIAYKVLFALEKRQYKKAKYVITAAAGMDRYAEEVYGIVRRDCFVKPACVDLSDFSPEKSKDPNLLKELDLQDKIVCVYAGKFGGLYLENETFEFFKTAASHFGLSFRVLLLTGHSDQEIDSYCNATGFDRGLIVKRFVPHAGIARYIGLADFAVCPMKPLPSRRYGAPIKNGEYWAMGLPVVITAGISNDSDLIEANEAGYVLKALNTEEYKAAAKKMEALIKVPGLHQRIRNIAERERNFSIADKVYRTMLAGIFPY